MWLHASPMQWVTCRTRHCNCFPNSSQARHRRTLSQYLASSNLQLVLTNVVPWEWPRAMLLCGHRLEWRPERGCPFFRVAVTTAGGQIIYCQFQVRQIHACIICDAFASRQAYQPWQCGNSRRACLDACEALHTAYSRVCGFFHHMEQNRRAAQCLSI